jgi:DNA repair protein RadA/Sms
VRPVTSGRQRESEATRMGFTTLITDNAGSVRQALTRSFDSAKNARERELDAAF